MEKFICVFSSSSSVLDRQYFEAAQELGTKMARRGFGLIFGGGVVGLMGQTARAVHESNGRVVGVIPEALNEKGIVYERCDELIVTKGLRERKAIMDERAFAFIALPGGFGTLEELLEIITLKQLRCHNKPIVILNVNGFYNGLIQVFENIIEQRFAKVTSRDLYHVAENVDEALSYIENYVPVQWESKWLTDVDRESED
ncbi:MAG: TIGR00730 family Rossman fold protein [Clostridia bacterium]|nr:TIGR00730 family Rossman fold protein [Clostridia bacterium]